MEARSFTDHNTKLYQFHPRHCAVILNIQESPLSKRRSQFAIWHSWYQYKLLSLGSVWGTGRNQRQVKATNFTVCLSSPIPPPVIPSLKWSAVFPSLYEQAFKGYYFCSNGKTKWFRLFILPLPIGTVFIGLLNQTKAKTRQTERCMVCLNCPAKHGIDWMAFYPSEENQFSLHENSVEWASDPCWRPPPGLWYR